MRNFRQFFTARPILVLAAFLVLACSAWAQVFPPSATGSSNFDLSITDQAVSPRSPSALQQQAAANFRTQYGAQAVLRWDDFSGSVSSLWDFRSPSYSGDPAAAALAFVSANKELFGISDTSTLKLGKAQPAMGGWLVRFDQTYRDIPVQGGGIGVALNKSRQVIAAFGPYFQVGAVATSPVLSADEAVSRAQFDLGAFAVTSTGGDQYVSPALQRLESALGPFTRPSPQLAIFPTGDGARLAWNFYLYSRNPFGVFRYNVDAVSGAILSRENMVRAQATSNLVGATGDIFPKSPTVTKQLQDTGVISRDGSGRPLGQLRVTLRNFDASNRTTGVSGELTGTHAQIHNVLALQVPFPQPPLGTWHFAQDMQPVEQATRDDVHFGPGAEPAEHQDEINIFFFINYLLEYVTDLHVRDDKANDPLRPGEGDFPDTFPNKDVPLQGIVHMPCPFALAGQLGCPALDTADPDALEKQLGLDNAFSLPLVTTIAGQEVVVNPTMYGHGYLFNDLALEGGVAYHEGMHSVSTPIAGFEGPIEGGALNEAQADLWAATITQNPVLGAYVVNAFRLRQAVRAGTVFKAANGNPDLVAWIRNANSGLLYSQLCRFNRATRAPDGRECEVHQDGEIYLSTMWDVRELLHRYETSGGFFRPDFITGQPTVPIRQAQETWERLFLGALYVLGIVPRDTFVAARDAMILADALLYPSGLQEPGNPRQVGMHRTLIEQVFAAREMGFNSKPAFGGRQTVSTAVSSFTGSQPRLGAPKGVKATVFGDGVQVCWKPVTGALAYEVRKRRKGQTSGLLYASDPATHEYTEGDATTDGFGHVDYTSSTCLVDRGQIVGFLDARGIPNAKDFQYGVRTLNLNPNNTIGVSETAFVDANTAEQVLVDTQFYDGVVPVGSLGLNLANGVDYVDVPFTAKAGAYGVEGTLSVDTSLGVFPDVDFYLYEVQSDGSLREVDNSGNPGPNEQVSGVIMPGRNYIYRVVGFANVATNFHIKSDQFILQTQ